MMSTISPLLIGFIFALGLGISGMTRPSKVQGFLDVSGNWDPSLAFVMLGAVFVHGISYFIARRRVSPILNLRWQIPNRRDITPSLIVGSSIFGIGWALGGYCPGPALSSLALPSSRAYLFVGSMIAGMVLFRLLDRLLKIPR